MIKIIAGVYGYKENGIISPKDKDSAPFSLSTEREEELVAQGVAEYANMILPEGDEEGRKQIGARKKKITQKNHGRDGNNLIEKEEEQEDEQQEDEQEKSEVIQEEDKPKKPEYNEKMKFTEIQKIAQRYQLDTRDMRTKEEVILLLDEYFGEDDAEEPPAFGAIDPVE